ncbi:MAG: glycerol-3-phosphate 1-O-acyltransferase PlsY [Pseudomonadota bacterium]
MDNFASFYPILAAIAAYLVGSLSFAVIVSKLMGLNDPRTFGSKNPGATNVLRSGNKSAAILTLVLDALKGYIPVALVQWFGKDFGLSDGTVAMVGIAAFLGHLYPVFFKFVGGKGGKGVATALGVVFGVHWALGLLCVASFAIIVYFFRWVSMASLVAAAFAPIAYLFGDRVLWATDKYITLMLGIMAMFLVYRHGANITRLIQGNEPKLGDKKPATAVDGKIKAKTR